MAQIFVMCPQNSYLSPKGTVYMGEEAEVFKIRLKDYLSTAKEEKIFFREKRALEDEFFMKDKTHSIVNSFDYHIEESLKKYAGPIFDKTRYSSFYGTDLDRDVKIKRIKSVILIGLETHTSILFTAEELRNRNIDVTIIEPLLLSRDEYMHNVAITLMVNQLGVRLGS